MKPVTAVLATLLLFAGCAGPDPGPSATPSAAKPQFSVLKSKERTQDTPPVGNDNISSQKSPKEWRWVANSLDGKLYLGENEDGQICVLSVSGADAIRVGFACDTPTDARLVFLTSDTGARPFAFFAVPDGYATATVDGLECNVSANSLVITNPPKKATTVTFTGQRELAVDIQASRARANGAPSCA